MISAADEHSTALEHVRNLFDLTVHAPYREAAALFGPNGERAWAGDRWDPQFLYPVPAKDVPGAVFAIQHGDIRTIWVNTAFDLEARHFQYVYFIPDLLVTTIEVRFAILDAAATKVTVVYERTALTDAGNAHVRHLGEQDKASGKEWETAIAHYLEQRKHVTSH